MKELRPREQVIEILSVTLTPDRDAYTVTGQVGPRQKSVEVDGMEVTRALIHCDAYQARQQYELRDLTPFIAQLATPALAAAFKQR